jgi:hypothetical protein
MSTISTITRVERAGQRFCELDELVLRLKGLVLARRYRERIGADAEELHLYDDEIESVREELAAFVSTRTAV